MARSRNIKPGFFKNEDLAEVSITARLLFIGLWTLADREGYLEDRPRRIKMELFPMDSVDIDEALSELSRFDLIVRYESEGTKCIFIPGFSKHQNPHYREKPSGLPKMKSPGPGQDNQPDINDKKPEADSRKAKDEPEAGQGKEPASHADSLIPDSLIPDDTSGVEYDSKLVIESLKQKMLIGGGAPPDPRRFRLERKGKFLMAENWEPSDSYLALQIAAGHDKKTLKSIVGEFIDFWRFEPGKNHLRDQTGWELLLSDQIRLKSNPKSKAGQSGRKNAGNDHSSGENRHFGARSVQSGATPWPQSYKFFEKKKPKTVTDEVRRRTQAVQAASMAQALASLGKSNGNRSATGGST